MMIDWDEYPDGAWPGFTAAAKRAGWRLYKQTGRWHKYDRTLTEAELRRELGFPPRRTAR